MKKTILMMCITLFVGIMPSEAAKRSGSKPEWVSKGEASLNTKRTNETYYFKAIYSQGRDLQALKNGRIQNLSNYIGQSHHLSGQATTEIVNRQQGESVQSVVNYRMVFSEEMDAQVFYAILVDEYWEQDSSGEYRYHALFAVSERGDDTVFDQFSVTRTYGAAPALMSIIPGVGQLYKGNKAKGITMLAGAAACAGAIIYCDNLRASYITKMHEQPNHAKTYKTKADNFETGRNIAIGVAGALVVYSIVDAAVAPGATRIKVRRGNGLSIRPTAFVAPRRTALSASLTYNF